jgi:hypothetical protein
MVAAGGCADKGAAGVCGGAQAMADVAPKSANINTYAAAIRKVRIPKFRTGGQLNPRTVAAPNTGLTNNVATPGKQP